MSPPLSGPTASSLRRDALRIWRAGVEAVRSDRLVRAALRVEGDALCIGEERLPLGAIGRIAVVGAGKAGAGMAAAVEQILGPRLIEQKQLVGWVNVPADCVRPLGRIVLHPARPPGINEPTPAGAAGAAEILRIVESLGPDDLCLCLISGGGSALMPAPVEGIALEDKLAVTRFLSAAGANIEQFNAVRKQLSRIKGGGLARACRAGRLGCLIISDVLGDPLDTIASGPTVEDRSTPADALAVLEQFDARRGGVPQRVFEYLRAGANVGQVSNLSVARDRLETCPTAVTNLVIGNNATAVSAAGREAERLGHAAAMLSGGEKMGTGTSRPAELAAPSGSGSEPVPIFSRSEGPAEQVGVQLAETALRMRAGGAANCLVSGGEPVVSLVEASRRGLGGRNQQLVLAALQRLWDDGAEGIVLLSGGTDGEDGPTDAAGAVLDAGVLAAARRLGLDPADYLARNDAYRFFEPLDALIRTGPTHTNVCDLRVVLVERK